MQKEKLGITYLYIHCICSTATIISWCCQNLSSLDLNVLTVSDNTTWSGKLLVLSVLQTRRPASADRTARRQFQATGQPVSWTQASDAMTSRMPRYEAKCVESIIRNHIMHFFFKITTLVKISWGLLRTDPRHYNCYALWIMDNTVRLEAKLMSYTLILLKRLTKSLNPHRMLLLLSKIKGSYAIYRIWPNLTVTCSEYFDP